MHNRHWVNFQEIQIANLDVNVQVNVHVREDCESRGENIHVALLPVISESALSPFLYPRRSPYLCQYHSTTALPRLREFVLSKIDASSVYFKVWQPLTLFFCLLIENQDGT